MIIRIIFLVFIFFSASAFAKTLNFVSIKGLFEQEVGRVLIPVIFKKLSIDVDILPVAAKRAQRQLSAAAVDGEIMRVFSYGLVMDNAIRVPTAYFSLETMGFVKKSRSLHVATRKDIEGLKVVIVRGVKHTEDYTNGMRFVHAIGDTNALMNYLDKGRADIALTNTLDGLSAIKRNKHNNLVSLNEPLATQKLYIYLHKRHAALVPKVDEIIKSMLTSGEMQRLIEQAKFKLMDPSLVK